MTKSDRELVALLLLIAASKSPAAPGQPEQQSWLDRLLERLRKGPPGAPPGPWPWQSRP